MIGSIGRQFRGPWPFGNGRSAGRSCSELVSRMPNDRHRRRAARRRAFPRLRTAPVLLLGLFAAAVLGQTPSGEPPIHWTMREDTSWMNDWDGVRDVRLAAAAAAVHREANQLPLSLDGAPLVAAVKAEAEKPIVVAARPVVVDIKPIVVAEADLVPRDVPKQVPLAAEEPVTTGSVPSRVDTGERREPVRVHPTINRTGKTDRLFAPAPLGRSTEQEIFVKPTLAVVPPSQDGWPPVVTLASLTTPLGEKTMPRLAWGPAPDAGAEPVVVALVRSGPGRVVTQSVIAGLDGDRHRAKGRVVLPPVPEAQVATLPPRSRVWAQPDVPVMGYTRTNDVEYRFKALLGDEETATPSTNPDDQLPP